MSDIPTSEEKEKGTKLLYSLSAFENELNQLNSGRDFPDLRHARIKFQSAYRGVEDFLKRKAL